MKGPDRRLPAWSLALQYESEVRKHAYRLVRDGSATDLSAALSAACSAPELYTMHFIGPMSFATFASAGGDALDTQEIDSRRRPYGKGRGKGGKGPAAPPIKRAIKKHSRTNDGQLICFAFNKASGCSKKSCSYAQRCLGKHPYPALSLLPVG